MSDARSTISRIAYGVAWFACFLPASTDDSEPIKHAAENPPGAVTQLDRVEVTGQRPINWIAPMQRVTVVAAGGLQTNGSRSGPTGGGGAGAATNPSDSQTDKPASNNNTAIGCPEDSASPQSSPKTGHPVIVATGEKFKVETDFDAASDYGLSHSRTYRSFGASGSMFGAKWSSAYDYPTLRRSGCYASPDYPGVCVPRTVVFTQPDGASYTYTLDGDAMYTVQGSEAMGRIFYDGPDLPVPWRLMRDHKTYGNAEQVAAARHPVATLRGRLEFAVF